NSFDAFMEKDKNFEVNNETWKTSNDVSIMDDSDSEEVENVFVKDNGHPWMVWLMMHGRRWRLLLRRLLEKLWSGRKSDSPKRNVAFSHKTKVHYFDKDDIEEGEHENAYSEKG
ncbi:hypothetical protein Tco_1496649, partial [Tanacetum coccineum]